MFPYKSNSHKEELICFSISIKMDLRSYLSTIHELRHLTDSYVSGITDFANFYEAFLPLAHDLFELTPHLDQLPSPVANEISHYLRWEGFGPWEGHIPQNPQWEYGKTNEPYGWIDQVCFRDQFLAEHAKLERQTI